MAVWGDVVATFPALLVLRKTLKALDRRWQGDLLPTHRSANDVVLCRYQLFMSLSMHVHMVVHDDHRYMI